MNNSSRPPTDSEASDRQAITRLRRLDAVEGLADLAGVRGNATGLRHLPGSTWYSDQRAVAHMFPLVGWKGIRSSNRFEGFDWFAGGEGVEDVGTEVDAVGPHDGAGFGVYLDLFEEGGVFERAEHSAPVEDTMGEVKLVDGTVGEG